MGFAYIDLIPPAILLDNPDITREDFVRLLNKTHCSWMKRYEEQDPWNSYDSNDGYIHNYHKGLEGLAGILGLRSSKRYIEFQKEHYDEHRLLVRPPFMLPAREDADYKFEVVVHERNIVKTPEVIETLSWCRLKPGDIWEEIQMGYDKGIVTRIIEERFTGKEKQDDEDEWDNIGPQYNYKMEIKPFHGVGREEKFRTKEELYEKWPQFHPNFQYDWAQDAGSFYVMFAENNFFWRQHQGRYFLDEKTFDKISPSFRVDLRFGYTDLVVTAEAIRHKAWKLLSYRGDVHIPVFLRAFPDSRKRHARAVWDAYTSLYAKSRGMNIKDFLRLRAQ